MAAVEPALRPPTSVIEISLEAITPAKDNPRRQVGDVAELARSIETAGLLEPLVLTPAANGFTIVCGHRRYAAAKKAGLVTVPAIVREFTERERQEAMLIENLQREDLAVLEEADAYRRLVDLGISQRELADRIGRSQAHVSKRLALLELPAKIRKEVDSGGITLEEAQELLKLKEHPNRLGAAWSRRGQHYRGIRGTVADQLEEIELDAKRRAAEAKLEKEGVRILQFKTSGYYPESPKGATEISKEGGWTELTIDPKTHAKEPCHAAAIHPRTFDVHYFCTDRKRHPKLKTRNERHSQGRSQDDTKKRQEEKDLAAARKTRRELVSGLLRRRLPKDDVVDVIITAFLHRVEAESRKVACQLLGLEPALEKNPYGTSGVSKSYYKPIDELAAGSRADRLKVALALAFATEERALDWTYGTWREREAAWLDYLVRNGYELSPAEKKKLGKARKAR